MSVHVGIVTEKRGTGKGYFSSISVFSFQYHSISVRYSFYLFSKGQAAEAWGLSNTAVLSEISVKVRLKNTFLLFL
jgi:hypothetical protein